MAMPPPCAIAHEIAFGFIPYVGVKVLAGRVWHIHSVAAIPAVLFVYKFVLV